MINDIRQIESHMSDINCYSLESLPPNSNIKSITVKNNIEHTISDISCAINQLELTENIESDFAMENSDSMKIRLHSL